eukprot:m.76558 g.76558  ORF g.76558 m.76558 type:complete len:57 (+) comp14515_c0_seq1:747-917(+)
MEKAQVPAILNIFLGIQISFGTGTALVWKLQVCPAKHEVIELLSKDLTMKMANTMP